MKWNVFYYNSNSKKIEALNIFDHWRFAADVKEARSKSSSKAEFAERLRKDLMYYFWCKAEYEVIIGPWCGGDETANTKVDIYTQVMNNWTPFLNYVWTNTQSKD